jgi:hypothetical protein
MDSISKSFVIFHFGAMLGISLIVGGIFGLGIPHQGQDINFDLNMLYAGVVIVAISTIQFIGVILWDSRKTQTATD